MHACCVVTESFGVDFTDIYNVHVGGYGTGASEHSIILYTYIVPLIHHVCCNSIKANTSIIMHTYVHTRWSVAVTTQVSKSTHSDNSCQSRASLQKTLFHRE